MPLAFLFTEVITLKVIRKEARMTQQQLEERAQEAWEAFLAADWRTADARLNDWLDAYGEAREGGVTPAQRAMGREVAAMMREFYGDPENERRYQEWKTERGRAPSASCAGPAPGSPATPGRGSGSAVCAARSCARVT